MLVVHNLSDIDLTYRVKKQVVLLPAKMSYPVDESLVTFQQLKDHFGDNIYRVTDETIINSFIESDSDIEDIIEDNIGIEDLTEEELTEELDAVILEDSIASIIVDEEESVESQLFEDYIYNEEPEIKEKQVEEKKQPKRRGRRPSSKKK